ncbi:antiviral RADAR system adenosine triphosphatase RdrA [Comamonas sediminis]|uniref:antiviral RADAR system adenosine triphosphatase RdrA n=1 Tax=Comamonas sediminis TaxID=1783360 RepID=UPI003D2AA5C2
MIDTAKPYISTTQQETASLPDPNTLLARDVYERLYALIDEAQNEASKALKVPDQDFDSLRAHNAALIDGARGTGKSTVLVNLPAYLKQRASARHEQRQKSSHFEHDLAVQNKDLLARVHILKPVDPTLLEEHDDLFLHVIVAAVLSDSQVQHSQHDEPKYRAMLRALEDLAHGLESVDAQKEERGLDKLRSFIGNRQLNSKVHAFFRSVLTLLGKDLLVLTIDDVDTALDRAYENLEVVRRYLNTPLVLPIISGDLNLYFEVIWREFQGKIVKPTPKYKEEKANELAIALAIEYQRKVLPVPNRMRMPDIAEYLSDFQIELRSSKIDDRGESIASLGAFHAWLKGFIAGPVNELENSRLALPIPSIRALTQLIRFCGQDRLLEKLPSELRKAKSVLAAKRAGQLASDIKSELVDRFEADYANVTLAKDRDFRPVYKAFADAIREMDRQGRVHTESGISLIEIRRISQRLRELFGSEAEAGATCLVLEAMQHWYSANPSNGSILATPLFQPLRHANSEYESFKKPDSLNWGDALANQLPGYWLDEMTSHEVLVPYPVPESGRWGRLDLKITNSVKDPQDRLLMKLLTHSNYYSQSSRGTKVNIGRLFELLVTSLVRDVSTQDVINIMNRAPFHSTSMLAPTKTQHVAADIDPIEDGESTLEPSLIEPIQQLVELIKAWRVRQQLEYVRFSPWLVYNVFNKVFNQAQFFNRNLRIESNDTYAKTVFQIGLHAFYSIWSACGSFEKGPLFGLPASISTVNLDRPRNFEQNTLFRQNILPFFPQDGNNESDVAFYGKAMRAATYYLGSHPLREWLERAVNSRGGVDEATSIMATNVSDEPDVSELANRHLRRLLGLPSNRATPMLKSLEASLLKLEEDQAKKIINEMHEKYPETEALRRLERAYGKAPTELSRSN